VSAADYERDGYRIVRGVLDADLCAEAERHVRWLCERHPDVRPEQFHAHLAVDDPFWIRLVSDPRLLDLVESIIGPDIALFATHYTCKPPRTGQQVLWHQDGAYWPLDPMEVVSLWLAVTDSDTGNGCLRVIPGTQHTDLQSLRARDDVESVLGSEIDDDVDASAAVDLVMQAGDVEMHHPNIVHGSRANTSDRWRMGLTIRYIPTSTRITINGAGCPLLLRGRAVDGINDYLPMPLYVAGEHMPFEGAEEWNGDGQK
jgi:ectoine hydroxylase-related dioxygenase (phytanoyl-CoA dioxygenase family)